MRCYLLSIFVQNISLNILPYFCTELYKIPQSRKSLYPYPLQKQILSAHWSHGFAENVLNTTILGAAEKYRSVFISGGWAGVKYHPEKNVYPSTRKNVWHCYVNYILFILIRYYVKQIIGRLRIILCVTDHGWQWNKIKCILCNNLLGINSQLMCRRTGQETLQSCMKISTEGLSEPNADTVNEVIDLYASQKQRRICLI